MNIFKRRRLTQHPNESTADYAKRVILAHYPDATPEQIERVQHKATMMSLRNSFLFFGYDLTHLTDEEIEQGLIEGARLLGNTGITVEQATAAFLSLGDIGYQVATE